MYLCSIRQPGVRKGLYYLDVRLELQKTLDPKEKKGKAKMLAKNNWDALNKDEKQKYEAFISDLVRRVLINF